MKSRPLSASTAVPFGSSCQPKVRDLRMTPKVTVYHSNGSGRDTYINYNNGGFRNIGPYHFKIVYNAQYNTTKSSTITPKFPIYKSNGRGRDSYIYTTCGGFYKNEKDKGYESTLRSYDGYRKVKKNDYLYYANHFEHPYVLKERQQLYKIQRATSSRLARPKVKPLTDFV